MREKKFLSCGAELMLSKRYSSWYGSKTEVLRLIHDVSI